MGSYTIYLFSLSYFKYFEIEPSIDFDSQFATMENDPLILLTEFYEKEGYLGKEAVEKAEVELERRHQRQLELNQSAGKNHLLLFFVPPSVSTQCSFQSHSLNIYDSYDDSPCLISFPFSLRRPDCYRTDW